MNKDVIEKIQIKDLNFDDIFFDSLRTDYEDFDIWLKKKADMGEEAYVLRSNGKLVGFLYLKDEEEDDLDIIPAFDKRRRLKIGTLKIDSHGTILGQRFLSIILRKMLNDGYDFTYATLFKKQAGLINLFEKFGFLLWGKKSNGELVYFKDLKKQGDIYKDFPRINLSNNTNKHLLSIYPEYHTKLFPDSRLNTECNHIVEDLSFTNTSEKIYLCNMVGVINMKPGDFIVIYRTKDNNAAEYSSVATSICTVVEMKYMDEFNSLEGFINYCGEGTIFNKKELTDFWAKRKYPYIIKMLYNAPLNHRIIRKDLVENIGLDRKAYMGYVHLTDEQFAKILKEGELNESFIIY